MNVDDNGISKRARSRELKILMEVISRDKDLLGIDIRIKKHVIRGDKEVL